MQLKFPLIYTLFFIFPKGLKKHWLKGPHEKTLQCISALTQFIKVSCTTAQLLQETSYQFWLDHKRILYTLVTIKRLHSSGLFKHLQN